MEENDTIAAVATPVGVGAIAVIRVSGPEAVKVVGNVVQTKSGLSAAKGNTVHHGFAVDRDGERVDEVLATVFRAPHSYTGEDLVEVGCHGGMVVTGLVLESITRAGARHAEPGEFTRRAYLNGKMDLAQAEGVMGIIAAQSRVASRVALAQLEGRLGQRVKEMRQGLIDLCALLEADLDFAEEGIVLMDRREIGVRIGMVRELIEALVRTYASGRVVREGVGVALVGRPNAGKSSLFNALVRESRAIVTSHPGTTRDIIEEAVMIGGMLFRLHDTAGIRESEDIAEREGVKRSLDAIRHDDVVMFIIDITDPPQLAEVKRVRDTMKEGQTLFWVMSKWDKYKKVQEPIANFGDEKRVCVSAITGEGLTELEEALCKLFFIESKTSESVVVTEQRHFQALERAVECLRNAERAVSSGFSNEVMVFDVREAAEELGGIIGEVPREEVLNAIFAQFCIGK